MEKQIINQEEVISPEGTILIITTFDDGSQVIVEKIEE